MVFPKLKLSYFDIPGRALAVRLAFFIGRIPFEDDRFPSEAMTNRKPELPYGVVPVLQVDDQVLAESSAIARYAGRLAGLYPLNNPLAALMVDEIMQAIDEFGEQFRPWFNAVDPEFKRAQEKKLVEEIVPKYLSLIDARLAKIQEHTTFQDPSRLFIHEIWLYQYLRTVLLAGWLTFVPQDIHKSFKHCVACEDKVANHPRVLEWNAIQSARPTPLKLTSFNVGGRAEPIRLAFHLGGIAFEDDQIVDYSEFLKRKPSFPYGQVPVLEINDTHVIGQSYAILRYAGTLTGLYPVTDDLLALRVDELTSVLDQLHNWWAPSFRERNEDKLRAMREVLAKDTIPKVLSGLDKRVAAWSKPHATGETFTVADLAIYGVVDFLKSGLMKHVPVELVDEFPALLKIHALVAKNPKVEAYFATAARLEKP